jgi:DNA polymerase elongation subunit (family B)
MDARTRRKITQETGAIVSEGGETGKVVGHYDDDSVYVLFDGKTEPERVWVEALTLIE